MIGWRFIYAEKLAPIIYFLQGLRAESPNTTIGVKRMGDLDHQSFLAAAKKMCPRKCSKREVDRMAMEICSQWEMYIRDSNWHPFRTITDEEGNAKVCIYITYHPQSIRAYYSWCWIIFFLLLWC